MLHAYAVCVQGSTKIYDKISSMRKPVPLVSTPCETGACVNAELRQPLDMTRVTDDYIWYFGIPLCELQLLRNCPAAS